MNKTRVCSLALVLAVAASSFAASIGTSPKGLEGPIERAALKFADDTKSGAYKLVTTEELKRWVDEKKEMTILSTLPADENASLGLLPGAVAATLPKSEKELTLGDREGLLKAAGDDKARTLVVYCGFVACRRSHLGAALLAENGYTNVYRYPAGITGWLELDDPVTK